MPSWLLSREDLDPLKIRTNDSGFLRYASRYFEAVFSIVAPLQFTNGGPIIALQVENEYGNTWNIDPDYLRSLTQV